MACYREREPERDGLAIASTESSGDGLRDRRSQVRALLPLSAAAGEKPACRAEPSEACCVGDRSPAALTARRALAVGVTTGRALLRFLDVMATGPERGEFADTTSTLAMPPARAPRAEHLRCSKSQAQIADRDRVLSHSSDGGSQQGHLRWGIGQWVKDEAKRLRVVKRTDFALRPI